jgi:tetratricopeptide (TPR) repeat protein
MKRILLTYLIIVFGLQILVAQNKSLTSADTYFEKRDYVQAIKHYKKAIKKSDNLKDQKNIAFQISISYYNMNNYQGALDWFEDAIDNNSPNSELYFKYVSYIT